MHASANLLDMYPLRTLRMKAVKTIGWKGKSMKIEIVSGEGDQGTVAQYTGKQSSRAIKSRITRECCNGDRWAFCRIDDRCVDYDDIMIRANNDN